ncbi:MAG: holo-ACP synthase [Proteobacteria bacterium]|nr:holo-ACP synthase [Pseudomonadota bacterium]
MTFGLGIDIIEVSRIQKEISKEDGGFRIRVFTQDEINYCESKITKSQNYAARFAAKEAFFKALGSGWSKGFAWNEVEVTKDESGKPYIITHGKVKDFIKQNQILNIHVSISHLKETAIAIVSLEK